jgi:hypothetical protein
MINFLSRPHSHQFSPPLRVSRWPETHGSLVLFNRGDLFKKRRNHELASEPSIESKVAKDVWISDLLSVMLHSNPCLAEDVVRHDYTLCQLASVCFATSAAMEEDAWSKAEELTRK